MDALHDACRPVEQVLPVENENLVSGKKAVPVSDVDGVDSIQKDIVPVFFCLAPVAKIVSLTFEILGELVQLVLC